MSKIANPGHRSKRTLAGLVCIGILASGVLLAGCSPNQSTRNEVIAASPDLVLVKKRTDDDFWVARETPVLADSPSLAALPVDSLSKYGGWSSKRFSPTGFFHTTKEDGTWWLVDPDGYAFISVGLNSVEPGVEATSSDPILSDRFFQTYESISDWSVGAERWMRANGFNTLGSWSDWRVMNADDAQVPYTEQLHLLLRYVGDDKRERLGDAFEYQWPHYHVFDPEFAEYCDRAMQEVAERTRDDPYLLGYFTDNELGLRANQLDRFLALAHDDPVRAKVVDWLEQRGRTVATDGTIEVTHLDRLEFYKYVADIYYRTVTEAVRRADPNHMILGDRFNYDQQDSRPLWEVAGQYIDVFSYNWYHVWNPNENNDLENWARWVDRPVMITEWYAKGLDTGMENDTGAGWIVATQNERGQFYQAFALGLLDNPNVVGFHWFRYRDNNVDAAHLVDPSNRDSNKGFFDVDHQVYEPLQDQAQLINSRVYSIRDKFLTGEGE